MSTVNELVLQASAAQTQSYQAAGLSSATLNKVVAGTSTGTQNGALFVLDCTTSSGTSPTAAVAIQGKGNYASASWFTLPGGVFQMLTSSVAAPQSFMFAGPLPPNLRTVATIGGSTPSFTYAVVAEAIG